jgi:subtilase family serine protease
MIQIRAGVLALAAILAATAPVGSPTLTEATGVEGLRIDASAADAVVVRLSMDDPRRFVARDGNRIVVRTPRGWAVTRRPGWPELPLIRLYVGLPPGGDVNAVSEVLREERIPGLAGPVPSYRAGQEEPARVEDRSFYGGGAGAYPAPWATVENVGWLRDQRMASVLVQPYRQEGRTLRVATDMMVRISFTGGGALGGPLTESAFESVHRSALVNYREARGWRRSPPGDGRPLWDPPYPAVKLYLDTDGLYRCTGSWLAQRGAPLDSINPQTLKLYNRGQEVPLYVAGQDDEADTVFSTADWLVFWGEHWSDSMPQDPAHRARVAGEFARENVYWLTWGGAAGVRYQNADGTPQGAPSAPDYLWTSLTEVDSVAPYGYHGEGEGEHITWCWRKFSAGSPYREEQFPMLVPAPSSDAYLATLRVRMRGYSEVSSYQRYHTVLLLNGTQVDEAWWGSESDPTHLAELPVSSALLVGDGSDVLTVRLYDDGGDGILSTICFDWVEVDYRRRYDTDDGNVMVRGPAGTGQATLSDFNVLGPWDAMGGAVLDVTNDLRLTGVQWTGGAVEFSLVARESTEVALSGEDFFLLPRAGVMETRPSEPLASVDRRGEYVIISFDPYAIGWSSPDLYNEAVALRWFWEGQGVVTALIEVQDVYDEFNWGVFSPYAVRDFMACAYQNWELPPRSLLLHGDASWDYHGHMGPKRTYVPALGNPANENFFACVTSDTAGVFDEFPDLHVGRWPIETAEQARNMLEKLQTYMEEETEHLVDLTPWQKRVLFVAGPENEGFHWYCNDKIVNYVLPPPAIARPESVFLEPGGWESQFWNREIRDHIDSGTIMLDYYGHGAGLTLGLLFDAVDADSLANEDRLTFLTAITCHAGRFANPESTLLGERMLRRDSPQHGAIGVWASTGLSQIAHVANTTFFNYLFVDYPLGSVDGTFGEGSTLGKLAAGPFVGRRYALLSDPEASIAFPTKPDLALYSEDILLKPAEPGANQRVRILPTLRNQGVAIGADSTAWIRVIVQSPSGDSTVVGELDVPCVWHLAWTPEVPLDWYTTDETGPHVVRVWVDTYGEITESREDNNVAEVTVDVLHETPAVSWPPDCALLSTTDVSLVVHPVPPPPGVGSFTYQFEIATADSFVPGLFDYQSSGWIEEGDVVTTWDPTGLQFGYTYFWRCRVRADDGDLGAWTEASSFSLGTEPGTWMQTATAQFLKNESGNADVASSPGSVILASQVSSTDYASLAHGATVSVSSNWEGHSSPQNLIGGQTPSGDFYFEDGDDDQWAVVSWPQPLKLSHVGSRQEAGTNDRAVWSRYRVSTSPDSIQWAEWLDLGPFSYPALEQIPSIVYAQSLPPVSVRHLRIDFGEHAQTGYGSRVMEIFARVVHFKPDGWLRSVEIGPAAAWDSLWWRHEEPQGTELRVTVSGWNVGAGQWEELLQGLSDPTGLHGIDASVYPRLILEAAFATTDSLITPSLEDWIVGFEGIADLVIDSSDVTYDSLPSPGSGTPIRFALRNVGLVAVDSAAVALYEQVGDSLVDLEVGTTLADLLPGGVPRWAELEWEAEEGTHTIVVVADPDSSVLEGDETNNSVSIEFRVLPNLAVQSISWAPDEPVEGDTLSISVLAANTGVVASPAWRLAMAAAAGQDTAWSTSVQASALDPGEELTLEGVWLGAVSGTWRLSSVADPEGLIDEVSEVDNARAETLWVATRADLILGSGDVRLSNPQPPEGDPVTVTAVTHNGGEQAAESVWVAFWDGEPGQAGTVAIGEAGPLTVAGLDSLEFAVEWPTLGEAGTHTLWAVADPAGLVSEASEDNNVAWVDVEVSPRPDLLVQGDTLGFAPAEPRVGDSLSVSLLVRNSGTAPAGDVTVRLREGVPGEQGQIVAPDQVLVSMTGLEERDVWFIVVPDEAGDLDLTVELDPDDAVAESNEDNNECWGRVTVGALPDLAVAQEDVRLEPSSPVEGQDVLVEARIRNLAPGSAGEFSVELWDAAPEGGGSILGASQVDSLGGNGHTDLVWSWLTAGYGGPQELWVHVDAEGSVRESREDNNTLAVAVEVTPDSTAPRLTLARRGFVGGDYLEWGDTLVVQGTDAGSGLDQASLDVSWDGEAASWGAAWELPSSVVVTLPVPQTPGAHGFTVRLGDMAGNVDSLRVSYRLGSTLRLVEALPYPNPASGPTTFVLGATRSGEVTVDIYTLAGDLVRRIDASLAETRGTAVWDGLDDEGAVVANGVYLFRVSIRSGSEQASHLGRLVVRR